MIISTYGSDWICNFLIITLSKFESFDKVNNIEVEPAGFWLILMRVGL